MSPALNPGLGILMDVQLPVTVRFGRADLRLRDALHLKDGAVIELDAAADSPVELLVNGHAIARGAVVMVDGNWAVQVQEILSGSTDLNAKASR